MLNTEFFEKAARKEPFYVPSLKQDVDWSVVEPGDLMAPTGRICACDPLVDFEAQPFAFTVPAGAYPVRLYVAKFDADERIAFAALWFSSHSIASWESALVEGQDPGTLKPGEFFGYGVDSGTGCFQTPEALALLNARMDREQDYFERIIEAMDDASVHTRSWARIQPEPSHPLSFLVFSSGFGDGFYGTYLGRDASGLPVCLAYMPEAESVAEKTHSKWWRFWRS
jgi:hypothetical protein